MSRGAGAAEWHRCCGSAAVSAQLCPAPCRHTTHVLVPLKPTGDVAMRSFKYLQGLAKGGVWLLSYDWLDRCLALGDWAPEEPSESRVSGEGRGSSIC